MALVLLFLQEEMVEESSLLRATHMELDSVWVYMLVQVIRPAWACLGA
jgi:hypothetical protein